MRLAKPLSGAVLFFGASGLLADELVPSEESFFSAEPTAGEIAKALQNPLAPEMRFDLNHSFAFGIDPYDGYRLSMDFQTGGAISLSDEWLLFVPSNTPLMLQRDVCGRGDRETGIGDMIQSFWLSPRKAANEGFFWGAGTQFYMPIATEKQISLRKWAMGPEGAIAWRQDAWTFSLIANHLWTYAGTSAVQDITRTTILPNCAYTFDSGFTVSVRCPVSYDWEAETWLVPLTFDLSQTFQLWGEWFCLGLDASYYVKTTDGMPQWSAGFRLVWALP